MEIMVWKLKTKSGDNKITSFEHHMCLHQQRRDTSGAKKENSNAVNLKNPDYSAWCFKNTGRKWNNHTEATRTASTTTRTSSKRGHIQAYFLFKKEFFFKPRTREMMHI
jgi:hypothetical protein